MMKFMRVIFISVAVVLVAQSCVLAHQTDTVFPGKEWERYEKAEDAGYSTEKLEAMRSYVVEESNTTGLFIVVGGKVLAEYGDVEELSYLASVRKSILAMLYGKYVENGKVSLEKTLEELNIDDNGGLLPIEKQATVHHLITARSGIYHPASNSGDNSADAPERGSQQPGEYMLYNNWDFNAAGAIFEMLTGMNIYDALERDLARPLEMQDFDRWAQRKSGNLERSRYPAYHIWLSTRDMARIGYLMLRQGNWNGKQVVSKQWAKRIASVVTPLEQMNPERLRDNEFAYGYMWWVWDGPEAQGPYEGAYTARGAWGQYITVLPALDTVIAHKTKSTYRRRTSWEMYEGILERVIDARLDQ
jgi:CubicO group peptidase (beta-lactamase class C family)